MNELIIQYEKEIEALARRSEDLKKLSRSRMQTKEHDLLLARIELLNAERYELMYSLALMKKHTGAKSPSPSLRYRAGDAAC